MNKEPIPQNNITNIDSSSSSKYISSNYNYISKIKNMFIKIIEKNNLNSIKKFFLLNQENFNLKILFDEIDSNKKGFINSIDLLNYLNNKYSEQIIRKIIQHYDKHSQYKLMYDDFKAIFDNINNNNTKAKNSKNDKFDLFEQVIKGEVELIYLINDMIEDIKSCENFITYEAFISISNNENNIDKNNMKTFLEDKCNENEINFIIYYLDINNDGLISYDEFEEFFVTLSLDENEVKSNINEINNIIKNNKNIEKNEYEKDNLQNMNYEKKLIIQKKENKQLDEKNEDEDKKIENKIDENNNSNINITKNESEHIDIQDYNNDINQKDKKEAYRVSNINYNIYKEFNNNIIEDNKYRNKEKINKEITENNYGNNSEYDIIEKERDNYLKKYNNNFKDITIGKNQNIDNTNINLNTCFYSKEKDKNNEINENEIMIDKKDKNNKEQIKDKENKEDNYFSYIQRNIKNQEYLEYKYNEANLDKNNNSKNEFKLNNNIYNEKIINKNYTSKNKSDIYNANINDEYKYSNSTNEMEDLNEKIIKEDEYIKQSYENNNNNEYNNIINSNNFSNNLTSTDFNKSDNFINENNINCLPAENFELNNNNDYNSNLYNIQKDKNNNKINLKKDLIIENNTNIEIKRNFNINKNDKVDNSDNYNINNLNLKEKYTNTNNNSNNGNSHPNSININGSLFTCGGNISVKTNNENPDIDDYNLKNNNNLICQNNKEEITEFKINKLNEEKQKNNYYEIENQKDYVNDNKYNNNDYFYRSKEKYNLNDLKNQYKNKSNTKIDYKENLYDNNNAINDNENEKNNINIIKNNLCKDKYKWKEEQILTIKFLQEKYKYNNKEIINKYNNNISNLNINNNLTEKEGDNILSSSYSEENNKNITPPNNNSIILFLDYVDNILKNENKCYTLKESLSLREDITFKELFCLFDYHQNKNISIHEFKKVCKNILSLYPTTDQIKLIFARYDMNKDEKLDLKEFLNMISPIKKEYLGILFGDKKVQKSFHSELSEKSKKIIINLVKSIILNESNYYEIREKMKSENFSMRDTWNIMIEFSKNKNYLNLGEFGKFLKAYSLNLTQYEIEIIFNKFDFDKDELINFEDFSHEFIF